MGQYGGKLEDTTMKSEIVVDALGHMGRMLSGSKQAPKGQRVFWNGNIYDSSGRKLWYGDINLTTEMKTLERIVEVLEEPIYVTAEQPFRWDVQTAESLEKHVKLDGPDARVVKVIP